MKGLDTKSHVPCEGMRTHTSGIIASVTIALTRCQAHRSVECNISNILLVRWFESYRQNALDLHKPSTPEEEKQVVTRSNKEAARDLRDLFCGPGAPGFCDDTRKGEVFVARSLMDKLVDQIERRKNITRFSLIVDCGRMWLAENTHRKEPGIIPRKRVDSIKYGAYTMFRATDDNSDLLEARYLAVFDKPYNPNVPASSKPEQEGFCFLERFRDLTEFELMCIKRWSHKLFDFKSDAIKNFWEPENL